MGELVTIQVNMQAFVRRDNRSRWVAVCPSIGVASQGTTEDDAKRCVREAVTLWFESCVERGVLDQALRESNFRAVTHGDAITDRIEPVAATGEIGDRDETDVRGEAFPVDVAIPAYQAAAFLAHM